MFFRGETWYFSCHYALNNGAKKESKSSIIISIPSRTELFVSMLDHQHLILQLSLTRLLNLSWWEFNSLLVTESLHENLNQANFTKSCLQLSTLLCTSSQVGLVQTSFHFSADTSYHGHARNISVPTRLLHRLWCKYLTDARVVGDALGWQEMWTPISYFDTKDTPFWLVFL